MASIFLSHSSQDNEVAQELSRQLKEHGYDSLFLDFDPDSGIKARRDWERELYRNLKLARAVIVLCSPNWGKPEPIGPVVPTVTEFEQVVREYKLTRPIFAIDSFAGVGTPQQEFEVHPGAASGSLGLRDRVHAVNTDSRNFPRVADSGPFLFSACSTGCTSRPP